MVEGTMLVKSPLTSHNSLKIVIQEMLLKALSMSTYIITLSRCRSKRAWVPKGMVT
jgi:hypothetical protein